MRFKEFNGNKVFVEMFKAFLPIAVHHLRLRSLPQFHFEANLDTGDQPSFGMYVNHENTIYIGLANRHPNDILRTIAHELTHYAQDQEHRLNDHSGQTGSPEENEAHAQAGVIMRHFNKKYPEFLKTRPLGEATDESLRDYMLTFGLR